MFPNLKPYQSVAWDFDLTLIKHEKSPLFWQFIIDNPYDQVHHIVTMRSHGWDRFMWHELHEEGSDLTRADFDQVIALPNRVYESYMKERTENGSASRDHDYHVFKGFHCKRIGAEVLIDDMEADSVSERGCDIHGIVHFHPDDL
jgi:hypothetical protein